MIEANEHPVRGEAAAVAELYAQKEELDTRELTAYAQTLGITPPDDRPDWSVVLKYSPDLEERGLVWAGPDED